MRWTCPRWRRRWRASSTSWPLRERSPPKQSLTWWSGSRRASPKIPSSTRSWWRTTPGWRRENASSSRTCSSSQKIPRDLADDPPPLPTHLQTTQDPSLSGRCGTSLPVPSHLECTTADSPYPRKHLYTKYGHWHYCCHGNAPLLTLIWWCMDLWDIYAHTGKKKKLYSVV